MAGKRKTHRSKTHRRKSRGGSCGIKLAGGKRKTRKMSKGADEWREGVMRVFKEMKAKDKNASFSDALKEASRRKKAGKL